MFALEIQVSRNPKLVTLNSGVQVKINFLRDPARTLPAWSTLAPDPLLEMHVKEIRRRDAFTKEDRDKILDYFRSNEPFYYPFIFTMFWTGMRPSECTALRVGDVDLKNGTISITKSRHLGEERAPKTSASRRTIKLLPNVVKVLRGAKELRVTEDDYFFKNRSAGRSMPTSGAKITGTWRYARRESGSGISTARGTRS